MKIQNFLSNLCVVSIFFACSTEDTKQENNQEIVISSFVQKNYNVTNSPNTIFSTINYEVEGNRIIKTMSSNVSNNLTSNSLYSYSGTKISAITSYENTILKSKNHFIYDTNDQLSEYRQESYNANNQITTIQKHTFTQTQDTIYSQWNRSTNGGSSYIMIANFKIVLDQNGNRTYLENNDIVNNEKTSKISTYDTGGNVLFEQSYTVTPTGQQLPTILNSASYTSNLNPLSLILEKTYGKKSLMLMYHLQTNAINNINLRTLSTNTLKTFDTTFDTQTQFEINNTLLPNNYANGSDYKTIYAGNLFSRFSLEFYFD